MRPLKKSHLSLNTVSLAGSMSLFPSMFSVAWSMIVGHPVFTADGSMSTSTPMSSTPIESRSGCFKGLSHHQIVAFLAVRRNQCSDRSHFSLIANQLLLSGYP